MKTQEMIEAIRSNYPPENYSELREALDHCLTLLKVESEGRLLIDNVRPEVEWVPTGKGCLTSKCSICGNKSLETGNFCNNCGVKMRGAGG